MVTRNAQLGCSTSKPLVYRSNLLSALYRKKGLAYFKDDDKGKAGSPGIPVFHTAHN